MSTHFPGETPLDRYLSIALGKLTQIPGVRRLWSQFPVGSVALRTEFDIWPRPAYAYGIYSAARLARNLGLGRVSVIEFGVAGGNGLLSMERIAREVAEFFGVEIAVYGFDTGAGLPAPEDYRDLPHVWEGGFYEMDVDALRAKLTSAELVLGNVKDTIPDFLTREDVPPIGFVSLDLDYYTSTRDALQIFEGEAETRLPRTFCYFDDVIHPERAYYNDYTGELLAINEFNEASQTKKIAKIPNLSWLRRHPAAWNEQMYVFHDFEHPRYTQLITPGGARYRQLQLK